MYFFGNESGRGTASPMGNLDDEGDEVACGSRATPRPRKHAREITTNGLGYDSVSQAPAAKRNRRSNGIDATTVTAPINGDRSGSGSDAMDIDRNGISHPDPERPAKADGPTAEEAEAEADADGDGDGDGDGAGDGDGDGDADARAARAEAGVEFNGYGNGSGGGSGSGSRSGNASGIGVGMGMDLDVDADADADADAEAEAEAAQEQPSVTLTLTNGRSWGVQSDKVTSLGPETSVLSVADKTVTHTQWNPRHPQILATGGDALCRIWNISKPKSASSSSSSPSSENSAPPPYVDLIESLLVSTISWSPDGELIAVATRTTDAVEWTGAVTIRTKTGEAIDELPAAQDMVLALRWNPSGKLLLGITSAGNGGGALIVWDLKTGQAMQPFELDKVVTDAAWIDDRKFTVCGHGIIADSVIDDQSIIALHTRTESEAEQAWLNIRFDSITGTTALSADEAPILAVIDSWGHLQSRTAHDDTITALLYQPVTNLSSIHDNSPRLLATSSLDGSVRIWDAKGPITLMHHLDLGISIPAMAMSFTPDGYLVTAANWNKVLIWNAEEGGAPKAVWRGEPSTWQPFANRSEQNGIQDGYEYAGLTHSLSWDADGGKLAYGLGHQVRESSHRTWDGTLTFARSLLSSSVGSIALEQHCASAAHLTRRAPNFKGSPRCIFLEGNILGRKPYAPSLSALYPPDRL